MIINDTCKVCGASISAQQAELQAAMDAHVETHIDPRDKETAALRARVAELEAQIEELRK